MSEVLADGENARAAEHLAVCVAWRSGYVRPCRYAGGRTALGQFATAQQAN
jgi:hypothetical protein